MLANRSRSKGSRGKCAKNAKGKWIKGRKQYAFPLPEKCKHFPLASRTKAWKDEKMVAGWETVWTRSTEKCNWKNSTRWLGRSGRNQELPLPCLWMTVSVLLSLLLSPIIPPPGKDSPNCFKNCFKFLNPALQGPPGSASNVQKEQETCRLTVYTEIYWE